MEFDLEGARKAGYSDAEIAGFLGPRLNFDVDGARGAGYSDTELVDALNERINPGFGTRMKESFKQGLGQVKLTWDFLANKLERAVTGGEEDTGPILLRSAEEYSRLQGDPKIREMLSGREDETWSEAAIGMSKYLLRNPSIVATFLAQQVPGIAVSLPAGGLGGAAAGAAARAAGASAAPVAAARASGFGASMDATQTALMSLGGNYQDGLRKFEGDREMAEDYAINKTAAEVPANAVAGAFLGISPLVSGFKGQVGNVLGQATAQGVGGMTGAMQAAEAVGEPISKREALMELGGEFFSAPFDIAAEALSRRAPSAIPLSPANAPLSPANAPLGTAVAPSPERVEPSIGGGALVQELAQPSAGKIIAADSIEEAIVQAERLIESAPLIEPIIAAAQQQAPLLQEAINAPAEEETPSVLEETPFALEEEARAPALKQYAEPPSTQPVTESQVPDTAQALETGDRGVATTLAGAGPQFTEAAPESPVDASKRKLEELRASKIEAAPASVGATPYTEAEWANEMSRLRDVKPRPLAKLYGKAGPTPEQAAAHKAAMLRWTREYSRASKQQKIALKRDNEAFEARRREQEPSPPTEAIEGPQTPAQAGVSLYGHLKDIVVKVRAIDAASGRRMKLKQRADVALANVDTQLEKARGLLECLAS